MYYCRRYTNKQKFLNFNSNGILKVKHTKFKRIKLSTLKFKRLAKWGRYLVETSGDQVTVLGMSARGNGKTVKSFKNLMNQMYGVNLQYTNFN